MGKLIIKISLIMASLVSILGLLACSGDDLDQQELRIGSNVWPGYEPLYLARKLGYFQDTNINLVEYSSATQVIRGFRNGLIDAAAITLDEALLLLDQGIEPRIILVLDVSNGADAVVAQKHIKTFSGLKQKKIGFENSALGAYVLSRALEINGLRQEQVVSVPLEINKQRRAFIDKRVDAVVTFDPVRSQLLELGGRELFDSRQMPGEIVDVLVVRDDFLKSNPKTIESLKAGWYRAVEYLGSNPQLAAQYISKRMKVSPAQVLDAYQLIKLGDANENHMLLGNGGEPVIQTIAAQLSEVLYDKKLIEKNINPEKLFLRKE